MFKLTFHDMTVVTHSDNDEIRLAFCVEYITRRDLVFWKFIWSVSVIITRISFNSSSSSRFIGYQLAFIYYIFMLNCATVESFCKVIFMHSIGIITDLGNIDRNKGRFDLLLFLTCALHPAPYTIVKHVLHDVESVLYMT